MKKRRKEGRKEGREGGRKEEINVWVSQAPSINQYIYIYYMYIIINT